MTKLLTVFFLTVAIVVTAQPPAKPEAAASIMRATVVEPEWTGTVYQLSEGKLVPLEHQTPTQNTKIKALGFGGGSAALVYSGNASPTRVFPNAEFVVRLEGNGDPSVAITVYRLTPKDGSRLLVLAKVGGLSKGFKQSSSTTNKIEPVFQKYGSSVKFTVPGLASGDEVAIDIDNGKVVQYLFGVDAVGSK